MHECAVTRALEAQNREREAMVEDETPYAKYQRVTEEQAKEAFSEHVIKEKGDRRWVIAKKYEDGSWCGFYLTEIIVGVGGTLIAHGDIDASIFSCFGKYDDPLQVVRWVANSGVANYLVSKATIGMTTQHTEGMTKRFDADVAIWEMEDRIKDRLAEIEEDVDEDMDEIDDHEIAAWRRAIRAVGGDAWEMVRLQLYDDLIDAGCSDVGEMIWDIGLVPASRIYYAQAACRRLLELLDAEKQPCPECHMVGQHKLQCGQRTDGQLKIPMKLEKEES